MALVKNPPANAEDIRDVGSIPGWGRSPRGGNGNPRRYPCLGNLMDREAWWAAVHVVAKKVRHDLATKQGSCFNNVVLVSTVQQNESAVHIQSTKSQQVGHN